MTMPAFQLQLTNFRRAFKEGLGMFTEGLAALDSLLMVLR